MVVRMVRDEALPRSLLDRLGIDLTHGPDLVDAREAEHERPDPQLRRELDRVVLRTRHVEGRMRHLFGAGDHRPPRDLEQPTPLEFLGPETARKDFERLFDLGVGIFGVHAEPGHLHLGRTPPCLLYTSPSPRDRG